MHVLICDDHPQDRQRAADILAREFPGLQVEHPTDAADFDAKLARRDLDLVLTESTLPWTSGLDLLRRLRHARPGLPAVMVTGSGDEDLAAAAMRLGAADYVAKARIERLGAAARAALDQAAAERAVALALRDKAALVQELYHRVNNSLQLVLAFLDEEAGRTADAEARARLDLIAGRVQAIALVQDQLYRSGDYAAIDIARYLDELAARLGRAADVPVEAHLASLRMPIGRAVPLGLIAHELLTGALARSAPDGTTVVLRLGQVGADGVLAIADAGRPIEPGPAAGDRLVRALVAQLAGTLDISTAAGTTAIVRFPLEEG